MAFKKDTNNENILVESKTTKKHYAIENLKAKKVALETQLESINNLLAECAKAGVKELV